MKLRKLLSAVVITAMMLTLFAVPAFAATYDLGEMNLENGDTQKGWATDGVDEKSSPYTVEGFSTGKYLVLEFATAPTGGMQIIWQGDGNEWGWSQTNGVIPDDGMAETQLVVDLSKTLNDYDQFLASTQIKLFLGYYSSNIADLQLTKAYFTDTVPSAAGGSDTTTKNPSTGDNNIVAIAIAALAVTGTAAFVLLRKKAAVK